MVGSCIGQRLQSICVEQAFRSAALHPDEGLDEAIGSTAMGGMSAALLSTTVTTKQHVKHSDAQELSFARRGNADALRMSNQEGSWYSRASSAA